YQGGVGTDRIPISGSIWIMAIFLFVAYPCADQNGVGPPPGATRPWRRPGHRGGAMQDQKLSVLEKVGFGAGDMAVNVVISSMMLIITFFYTDVFGLRPTDVALLLLSVRMIDAVTDPLMGMVTDRIETRWGRYRPYFLVFAVP